MLTKSKVADNIWAVYGDSQQEIGRAFIRFQEYYESTLFKGNKNFTVRDVEYWWKTTKTSDQWSYYDEWIGFNIPGRVIIELLVGSKFRCNFSFTEFIGDPLNFPRYHKEESQLLDLIEDIPAQEIIDSYFIGLWKDSSDVFDHELAHGLFTTNGGYRAEQIYNLSQLPTDIYTSIRHNLLDCGYHSDVIHDEIQAYLSTYVDKIEDMFETTAYNQYTTPFEETFKKFYPTTSVV